MSDEVSADELPVEEFGFPGPLRDRLVAAIMSGGKTATSGLLADYQHHGDPLPVVGDRGAVADSAGRRVAVIETTAVDIIPIRDVTEEFARAEGEGFATVAHWREAHENFWRSEEMVAALGGRAPDIDDDTLIIAQRFRLIENLPRA